MPVVRWDLGRGAPLRRPDALAVEEPLEIRVGGRPLAVTGDKRISAFPEVPSMAELGYPEVSLNTWQGVGAPAGTPAAT